MNSISLQNWIIALENRTNSPASFSYHNRTWNFYFYTRERTDCTCDLSNNICIKVSAIHKIESTFFSRSLLVCSLKYTLKYKMLSIHWIAMANTHTKRASKTDIHLFNKVDLHWLRAVGVYFICTFFNRINVLRLTLV